MGGGMPRLSNAPFMADLLGDDWVKFDTFASDPLDITGAQRGQKMQEEQMKAAADAKYKLDNPDKDPQNTTSVVQI